MIEYCAGVTPFPQPSPARNPGGDCFACALTAMLRHFWPDRPATFAQAYGCYAQENGTIRNVWHGHATAFHAAGQHDYRLEVAQDIVAPVLNPRQWSHPWWLFLPERDYARRLEGWLRSGWLAVSEINFEGAGPVTPDFRLNTTNHVVLLDGVRVAFEEDDVIGGQVAREYVHVVCSAKGAYWIGARDLLLRHGAAGWQLARPERR